MKRLSSHEFLLILVLVFVVLTVATIGLCYKSKQLHEGFVTFNERGLRIQELNGKYRVCSDDPNHLTIQSCGVDDNSMHKEQILKKIDENLRMCDDFNKYTPPVENCCYKL